MKKRTKNTLILGILIFFTASLIVPGVLAQDAGGEIEDFIESIKEMFTPLFEAILGGVGTNEALFSKFLLFVLVAAIVYAILSSAGVELFSGRPGLLALVSIIVSILGVRFLATEEIINAILLPYGSFFIAISVGIPFVLFFWVLEYNFKNNPMVRKLGWALFIAAFGILGWMRADDIGQAGYIYVTAICLALLAFWFDGSLQTLLGRARVEKALSMTTSKEISLAKSELKDFLKALKNASTEEERTTANSNIINARKNLSALLKRKR